MQLSSWPEPSLAPEQVLECLEAIALGIYQTQPLDDILNTAVQELRKLLQSDRVLIYRFQADGSGVVVVESVGSSWTPVLGQTIYDPCFTSNRAQAYRQGHFSAIADIYTREFQACYLELLAQCQVRANLVVPIRDTTPKPKSPTQNPSCAPSTPTVQPEIENPLWGLLIAHHCSDCREWQPLEVKLLQQIAVQIAIAIGQARAFEQIQTEVTQRQEVQAKLQASEQFLHSIYDGAANSIFVVDVSPTGEFRFAGLNSAHEQLSGLRGEDIKGKSPEQVLSAPVAAAVCANYARCVQAGTTISYEECLSFQGEENWWLTTLTPLRDAHSRIYRLTGTSINITQRKKAEQERDQEVAARHRLFEQIEQQNQTLETKVQERTAQLSIANEQLQQEVAERQQAEEALRQSEEKFRQIAENIQCVFWISNFPMTQTDYISPAYEKIWGRPCAELYASPKSWLDAVHPEDRDRIMAMLAKIRQDEHEKEYRIVRPDGEIRWIRDRSFPIRNETGEVYRVVGIAEDISDAYQQAVQRKQAEESLRQSEARFRKLFESNIVGIIFADFNGNITDANELFLQMVSYTREDLLLGQVRWDEMTPPEYHHLDRQAMEQSKTSRVSAPWEKEFIRKDGIRVPVLIGGALLDGFDDYVIAFVLDISERKQAEEALRESEQQFRQIFQDASIGMALANFQNHQFIQVNPAWCRLLGYSASEIVCLTFDKITHPDDWPQDLHYLEQSERGAIDSYCLEKRYFKKNGELMWANLTVTILRDQEGHPKFTLAMIEDITERKQLQIELLNSEERFRTSIENMLDCFGIYTAVRDESGQIVDFLIEYMNAAACTNHCTTKQELVGKRLCELMPAHRTTGLFDQYCQVVETGQPLVKEFLFYQDICNGRSIRAAFDIRAVKLGDGFACAWRDVTQRKQADDQLKATLLEKETLLKEIHHRVKNNLQVISSLLRLQSRQIRDQQTLELFKESQNRVQAMALIHEKLYQSSNLAQIDLQQYITTLVGNLCRSYDIHRQAVAFKINVEPVSLAIDTAIPCGLIINELITNSLKYAFPDNQGGEICIRLQFGESPLSVPVDRQQLILTISDNGIGLPEYLDLTNISSLGLQLVSRLTKQIGGILELNRSQGTEFKIAFAKPSSI